MTREIKFQIIHKNKVFAYERLKDGQWESMVLELNPDNGERWNKHVLTGECIRREYSNIQDKNGKDIYEGDLATDVHGNIYFIDLRNGSFIAVHSPSCGAEMDGSKEIPFDYLYCFSNEIEVIGNIYENPELI